MKILRIQDFPLKRENPIRSHNIKIALFTSMICCRNQVNKCESGLKGVQY